MKIDYYLRLETFVAFLDFCLNKLLLKINVFPAQVHYRKVHSYTDLTMPAIRVRLDHGGAGGDVPEHVADDGQDRQEQARGWGGQL